MSGEISNLPPKVQERLLRFQQLQQTLQSILTQKQQVENELKEGEQALDEINKTEETTPIYKTTGSLLIKSDRNKVINDLNERKTLLDMRIKVLEKQEKRLREQLKDLQNKLQQDLNPVSAS
jgi:prefoldin beta subunit